MKNCREIVAAVEDLAFCENCRWGCVVKVRTGREPLPKWEFTLPFHFTAVNIKFGDLETAVCLLLPYINQLSISILRSNLLEGLFDCMSTPR